MSGLADAVTGNGDLHPYRHPGRLKRFLEWLYRLTFEVGEDRFSTFGTYPEDYER